MVAEIKPLFPGQTGLTPGRRAELELATAPQAPDRDGPAVSGSIGEENLDLASPGSPRSGLLAELLRRPTPDADSEPLSGVDDGEVPEMDADAGTAGEESPAEPAIADESAPPMVELKEALQDFDASALASPDPQVRAAAETRLRELQEQAVRVDAVYDGVAGLIAAMLPRKLAERVVTSLHVPAPASNLNLTGDRDVEATSALAASSAAVAAGSKEQQQSRAPGGGSEGAGVIDGIVRSPFTFLAAGGSFAMQGLRNAASGVKSINDTIRKNSFDIMGQQVKSLHSDIQREAQWLRAHGMDGLVDEMKASGHSLRDAMAGMAPGGPLEKLGHQYKGLMTDPEFKQRFDSLQQNIGRFGEKAENYAKGGAKIGRDVEADVEAMCDQIGSATEGFPVQAKNGSFGPLADKIREISEKIREMLKNMFNRLTPGKG